MTSPEDDGAVPPSPRRRGRRRALIALLLIAALLAALWAALPGIATIVLRDRLAAAGVPQPRLTVTSVGWSRAEIAGLHLGDADEIAIDRLVVEYEPADLLDFRIRRVEVGGGHVAAQLSEGRLSLGSLDHWLRRAGRGDGSVTIPPQLSIADIVLSVTLSDGLVTLSLSGDFDTDPAGRLGGHLGVGGTLAVGDFSSKIAGRIEAVLPPAAPPTLTMQLDLVEPRYGEATFAPGQFVLQATPDGGSTKLRLGGAADPFMVAADATVSIHDGGPQLAGTAALAASADAPIWTLLGLPRPQQGRLALTANLNAGFADARLDWRQAEWNGTLSGTLDHGEWAGLAGGVAIAGAVDLVGHNGTITATLPTDLSVKATPDDEPLQSLPAALRSLLGGPLAMTLHAAAPAVLTVNRGVARLETDLTATIVHDRTRLSGALKGAGGRSDFAGSYALSLSTPQLGIGRFQLGDVAADIGGPIAIAGNRILLRLADGHQVTAKRATIAATGSRLHGLLLPLLAEADPFASIEWGGTAGLRVGHAVGLGPVEIPGLQFAELPDTPIDVAWPRLIATGQWSNAAGYRGLGRIADGTIALPDRQIAGSGLSADLRLGGDAELQAALRIDRIADQSSPPAFVPLRLDGTARLTGDRIDFSTGLADQDGHFNLVIAGRHSLSSQAGSATLLGQPIVFAAGGLQPHDLLPVLGALPPADGAVALGGSIGWRDGRQTARIKLLLRDLSFMGDRAELSRINGVIVLDGLSPLTTPPHQSVAVARADFGLPLRDGLIDFQLLPGPRLAVAAGAFHLAGGTLALDPATLGLGAGQALRLTAKDVDLARLLELCSIDGLRATGRLDGAIPLTIGPDTVDPHDGRLDAAGPGWLGYDAASPPAALQGRDEADKLRLAALADFHYEQLRLTLDRDAAGRLSIGLDIKGNNPSFENGSAVELNVNLIGELDRRLRRDAAAYHVPDSIRQQQSTFRQ